MSKNEHLSELHTDNLSHGMRETAYERLTKSPAHAILFVAGMGFISIALVEAISGQLTQPIARWRWLFQRVTELIGMGPYGQTIFAALVGIGCIAWAIVGTRNSRRK